MVIGCLNHFKVSHLVLKKLLQTLTVAWACLNGKKLLKTPKVAVTKLPSIFFFSSSRHCRARHHDLPVVPIWHKTGEFFFGCARAMTEGLDRGRIVWRPSGKARTSWCQERAGLLLGKHAQQILVFSTYLSLSVFTTVWSTSWTI